MLAAIPTPAYCQDTPSRPPVTLGNAGVNLNITPRRVVLDRASRTATVYIFNQGQAAATFDITLIDRVMLPDGQIRSVEQAQRSPEGEAAVAKLVSAHDLVLATPRRVTLAPGKGQIIRLRAVPPASATPAGEYRTHLTVTNVPPPETGLTAEAAASQAPNQLSFQIRSVLGLSIPVIIRTAPAEPHARLEGPRLTQLQARATPEGPPTQVPAIEFEIAREGRNSLFGNLEVRSGDRAEQPLAIARGLGVYPEIDRRHFALQLRRAPKPGETLTIVFTDDDARPGTELARTALKVP
ncbi:hypothetical protein [Sphingomonas soli]|uniref:hypothetical protein n=1 Tax=Sphingomonas soli TaxID=266127 RepID=UPI0012EE666C|nr:hypothetical protein [Sphingomonas soli]